MQKYFNQIFILWTVNYKIIRRDGAILKKMNK